MTLDDVLEIYDRLEGKCSICSHKMYFRKNSKHRPVIDHNHKTGEVRGLICFFCNILLGVAFENRLTLSKAIAYLSI